ncbi:hypothetical protein ACMYSO_25045 (plasmid) [Klebsiella sp. B345]
MELTMGKLYGKVPQAY